MVDLSTNNSLGGGRIDRPRSSARQVYFRLIRYAWNYKLRLLISLGFAIILAFSFGALLVGLSQGVDLTFYTPQYDQNQQLEREDPADKIHRHIQAASDKMESIFSCNLSSLQHRFQRLVLAMRADKMRAVTIMCIAVIVLALIINLARYLQEFFAGTIGTNISTDLGHEMYVNLMNQSVGFFETRSSGEILGRFANDIFTVNRGLAGVLVKLMCEPIKACVFLSVAFSADVYLTLIGICILPPVMYALLRIGKKMRKSVRRSLQKIASMTTVVNETVSGIAIVKGYNMEEYELGRMQKEINKLRRFLRRMVSLDAAASPTTEFILIVGVAIFGMLSGHRLLSGKLALGDMAGLFIALGLMLDPIRKLASVNNMIQTSVASAERVFEFIDMKPDIVETPNPVELPGLKEGIRFENVHFSYNGQRQVLNGIDFEIKKGELVALVGPSGAGKSTIVKLIPRFYDVTQGAIKIDGIDIRNASFKSLRNLLSIVTQDTILFAESVRDNIAYGQSQFSDERVRAAADAAHATEFIEQLPEGFNTVIGESGCNLSGGQRQRLAIARAIIKDPAILILDEATSSLDSESERHIQQALDAFVTGRTAIVIAHRLSTVRRADRILVINEGRLVEQGPHQELLAQGGLYTRLYETQFGLQEQSFQQ
ncbi:MAG TPA: ABC transporter ATP-binding protein [Candidatus Hydrogenedentes bacterium]|nr:ABC transporter ATP-binding protein [Candidatus Hydrogenedentota bacterium]